MRWDTKRKGYVNSEEISKMFSYVFKHHFNIKKKMKREKNSGWEFSRNKKRCIIIKGVDKLYILS